MLSEDDKNRIRLEEIFRQEVRQSLEREKPQQKSRWRRGLGMLLAFLNTGVGLWFLSSVAVGLITWRYTEWDKDRTEARENRHTAEKIDLEISQRLHKFTMAVDEQYQQYVQTQKVSDSPLQASDIVSTTVITVNQPPEQAKVVANVYPEFRPVSLLTLFHNLRDLNTGSEDDANNAIGVLQNLSDDARRHSVVWHPGDDKWEQSEDAQVREFIERIKNTLKTDLKRWSP